MTHNIQELIAHPEKLADRVVLYELQKLLAQYPYYQAARLLYLKGLYLLHDASFGEELRRAAVYVPDRKILFNLIEGEYYALKPVPRKPKVMSQEMPEKSDRTLTLIDAFLEGLPAELEEETPELIDDGGLSADYAMYELKEEDISSAQEEEEPIRPAMRGQQLIDDFIQKSEDKRPAMSVVESSSVESQDTDILPSVDEDDGYFTETLAKIYIKQQRYAKALEIIRRLSLKYPKKNAYFADQIRFLEKLVLNSNDK